MITPKDFLTRIVFAFFLFATVFAEAATPPIISADSAILVEASTGRIIYEKNSEERMAPASMTKMMTCILGLENLSMNEEVAISRTVLTTEDINLDWSPIDRITARDLLMSVMLVSENGGAVATAQTVADNIPLFAKMMNEKAKMLGCTGTNFANPNGLPNPNHYSTAKDMARIAVYCMKNPDFRKIVSTKSTVISWLYPKNKWAELKNTNELLGNYEGANGIKTGWTRAAGGCLAASAKRGKTELIAIVMHSETTKTRFDDAEKLLDYGFKNVKMTRGINKDRIEKIVFVRGGEKGTLHVGPQEDLSFPLMEGENVKNLKISYDLPNVVDAGVVRDAIVGKAVFKYSGKTVAIVPLVAREDISEGFSVGSTIVGIAEPIISVAQNIIQTFMA